MFVLLINLALAASLAQSAHMPQRAIEQPPSLPQCKPKDKECWQRRSEIMKLWLDAVLPVATIDEGKDWFGRSFTTLTLYRDGTIIYWWRERFMEAKLSPEELEEFFRRMRGIDCLSAAEYAPKNIDHFPEPSIPIPIYVYGTSVAYRDPSSHCQGRIVFGGPLRRGRLLESSGLSDAQRHALRFLAAFRHPYASEWTPQHYWISFSLLEKRETHDVDWPEHLPQPAHFPANSSESKVLITRAQYLEVKKFLGTLTSSQGVRIHKRSWSVSFTAAFPHEDAVERFYSRRVTRPRCECFVEATLRVSHCSYHSSWAGD